MPFQNETFEKLLINFVWPYMGFSKDAVAYRVRHRKRTGETTSNKWNNRSSGDYNYPPDVPISFGSRVLYIHDPKQGHS